LASNGWELRGVAGSCWELLGDSTGGTGCTLGGIEKSGGFTLGGVTVAAVLLLLLLWLLPFRGRPGLRGDIPGRHYNIVRQANKRKPSDLSLA